ncbi:MAG: hypothetical protein NT051_01275 [Candidatus Micrarchaeota archaeon]|nr:hypothetical protein [Candidatus Micrarchaeota archaeon]
MARGIFELAEAAMYGKRPEDIEDLRNTPGAKKHLLSILPRATTTKSDEINLRGSFSRISVAAFALGEIGTRRDAAHLNATLGLALAVNLDLAFKIRLLEKLAEPMGGVFGDMVDKHNFMLSEKAGAHTAVLNILEAMVKLDAQSQALGTLLDVGVKKVGSQMKQRKELEGTMAQIDDTLALAGTLSRMMEERKAAASFAKIAASNMKPAVQAQAKDGTGKRTVKN